MAAQEFASRGCRELILLRPDDDRPDFALRAASFKLFAKMAGMNVNELFFPTDAYKSGNTIDVLKKVTKPEGILFFHWIEFGGEAVKELGWTPENGVHVGSELRDLSELDEFLPNGSFGIDLRIPQIGAAAAEQLLWRIQHPQAEKRTVCIRPDIVRGDRGWKPQAYCSRS